MNIQSTARTDTEKYFSSVVLAYPILNHHPLLAFTVIEGGVNVEIIKKPARALELPDETPLMGLWPRQWRSDYMQFTAGELKRFAASWRKRL